MATLLKKGERWSLQFRLKPNEDRRTIALGVMEDEQAQLYRKRVGTSIKALRANSPPDLSTARWVEEQPDDLYAKLAAVGLVVARDNAEAPDVPAAGRYIDRYIKGRTADTGAGTRVNYAQTKGYLIEWFGATRPLDRISAGDADNFRRHLIAEKPDGKGFEREHGPPDMRPGKTILPRRPPAQADSENPFGDMKCSYCENRDGTTSSAARRPRPSWTPAPTPDGGCYSP